MKQNRLVLTLTMVLIVSLILLLEMQHELHRINRQKHLLLQARFQNEFFKNSAAISWQGRNEIQKKLKVLKIKISFFLVVMKE